MHLLTQSALLRALGWSLLNSLWQMAFLWLVYILFTRMFRRTSAGVRYGLAVLLLGAGTIWTIFSFFNAFLYTDPAAYPLKGFFFQENTWAGSVLQTSRRFINKGLPWCSSLYLLTLCFLFSRYARQYLYSRRLSYRGLSKASPEIRLFTDATSRQMGIKKGVRVWLSTLVDCPVTLGFLKPVILIPLATISRLTPQQVEALILHELAHISKQDYLLNLGIAAVEVLFFFNPFSKLLIRQIQKEREHRCDDLVLQFRYDPHAYVSALMTLAQGMQGSPRLVLAATGSSDRLLLQRVKRILQLDSDPEPIQSKPLLFLLFSLFIAGMTLARPGSSISQEEKTGQPTSVASNPVKDQPSPADREPGLVTLVSIKATLKDKKEPIGTPKAAHKNKVHSRDGEEEATAYDDGDQDLVQANTRNTEDDDGSLVGYATTISPDKRDFSITSRVAVAPAAYEESKSYTPYVPNASFSIQHVQDSTYPGEQSVYMQQMASRQVEQAILKMQKELQWQLKILQQSSSKEVPDLKQKEQIIIEQLKLQQQYLEKQQQLVKKMERVGKKRVIVVI